MKEFFSSIPDKGVLSVALSIFGIAFSFNFIWVFMPFYILKISPFGPKETMLWTGLIMGAPSVVTAFMSPVWGRLANKIRPKFLLEQGILWNGVLFLLFGFVQNLYLLLFLRILMGFVGGISTIGLVLVSVLSPKERAHKDMGFLQIAMTIGQLVGPPIGAHMVTLTGYRAAFIIAFLIMGSFLVFCHQYVEDIPCQQTSRNRDRSLRKGIFWGWILVLVATIHLTYIPSILPHILEEYGLKAERALNYAGLITMAYTMTAILGNYLINNFTPRAELRRVIVYIGLSAAFLQAAMYLGRSVFSFTVIRMLQTAVIAAVFPMILSIFARGVGGGTLGFLNSARFGGNATGPLISTSIVAYSNLATLYFMISGITLIALLGFLSATRVVSHEEQAG